MSNIIVTLRSNVKQDDQGEIELNEEGVPTLIDADDIGILVKNHAIMTVKFNQESGELDSGYTTRAEVYWDKRRNPSPSMHQPKDLVWMEFMQNEEEDFEDEEVEGVGDGTEEGDEDFQDEDYEEVEPLDV